MPDWVNRLADQVAARIRELGFDEPNRRVIGSLLETAYLGTLRSEEGRFVRGSLTFANPRRPDVDAPFTRRANYPGFTNFDSPEALTVQCLVKLARAIDRWSGSIAVYATRRQEIVAWGVVDQLVQQNVRLHRESDSGFTNPGLLTVTMDGIGDVSAYHGDLFLGGIKAQALVARENDVLESEMVFNYGFDALVQFSEAITDVLGDKERQPEVLTQLFAMWATSIARLCIGLRRFGTGGAFLLTPKPIKRKLQIGHPFAYQRLRDATILRVLDEQYSSRLQDVQRSLTDKADPIPADLSIEVSLAEADAEDRENEMTGAVKLVASLAAVDGLVLLTPTLSVVGFGVKIGSTPNVTTVYDGAAFAHRGAKARKIDLSQFGTRHSSMIRYCAQDRDALGIVVSQDGYVRLIMTVGKSLVLWDNLKLLGHMDYSRRAALQRKVRRDVRRGRRESFKLGYTDMPKTIKRLMKAARRKP
ncbi:MAG: putative sensor domain DACNV-containing protein [Vicinamibacterales bacterium]